MTTMTDNNSKNVDMDSEYIRVLGQCRHIRESENIRKSKPTKSDYVKLHSLLRDFAINIPLNDIPEFNSISEMEFWKKTKIKEKFENRNKPKEESKPMFYITKIEEPIKKKQKTSKKHQPADWSKINISF